MHTKIHTYKQKYIFTKIHTHARARTHTHTHTHRYAYVHSAVYSVNEIITISKMHDVNAYTVSAF
jgi:hypothetical protein